MARISIGLTFLALLLWAMAGLAQSQGGQGNSGNHVVPNQQASSSATAGQNSGIRAPGKAVGAGTGSAVKGNKNAGYLTQGKFSSPVPQYWITDAMIFIGNAAHAAKVASVENESDIQYLPPFKNQGTYIKNCVARSINDIVALDGNAMQTDPQAVPQLRAVLAELDAAYAQLQAFTKTAGHLDLGPTYRVTITSTVAHLDSADKMMPKVAREYNMGRVLAKLQQREMAGPPQ